MSTPIRDFANEPFFDPAEAPGYWVRFTTLLGISAIIATIGLYRNSGAVVIAAMLIAPLMTPILGIAKALVLGWTKRSLYLLVIVSLASLFTIGIGYLMMALSDAPMGMLIPDEVRARWDPGLEELLVALAAGIAGAYVEMRRQEASMLPGVAIGVSLVPPLTAAGITLYFGDTENAWDACLLFLTNLAAIVLAACVVFLVLGIRPSMRDKGHMTRVGLGTVTAMLMVVLVSIQLGQVTLDRFREARTEERVVTAVRDWAGEVPVEIRRVDVLKRTRAKTVELWMIIDVPIELGRKDIAPSERIPVRLRNTGPALRRDLRAVLGAETDIHLRIEFRYAGVIDLRSGDVIGDAPELVPPAQGEQ